MRQPNAGMVSGSEWTMLVSFNVLPPFRRNQVPINYHALVVFDKRKAQESEFRRNVF